MLASGTVLHWSDAVTDWIFGSADLQLFTVVLGGMAFLGAANATVRRCRELVDLRRTIIERGAVRVRSQPLQHRRARQETGVEAQRLFPTERD